MLVPCFTPVSGPFPARRSDKGLLSDFPFFGHIGFLTERN